jgi:hypothetical protein
MIVRLRATRLRMVAHGASVLFADRMLKGTRECICQGRVTSWAILHLCQCRRRTPTGRRRAMFCCRYAHSALTHSSLMAHAKLVLHEAQDQATELNLA